MKYKQRLVACLVLGCATISVTLIYLLKPDTAVMNFDSFGSGGSPVHGILNKIKSVSSRACKAFAPMTADYVVDDFYDRLKFTTGEEGLYVVYDNDTRYTNPKYKKILQPNEPLTIILVPHSHNDPGWLWTLMTYYEVRTKYILSNTVKFLTQNPDFRMIWSETIFLDIWWKEAQEHEKSQMKKLIQAGQLEILSGGWVSVDEATTHYTAVLDQLIEGHHWLKDTLNIYSNISWSIDPFGYSTTLPYLWKKAGMEKMAILRLHGALKTYMGNRQLLTFNWRQQWDKSGKHDILCHVEPFTLYNIEYSCGPDKRICRTFDFARTMDLPQSDNEAFSLPDGMQVKNFEELARLIVGQYRLKASQYKHNVILMPHGDDFRYIMEYEWQRQYSNMKRLIDFINSKKEWNVEIKFGTVGDYFKILERKIQQSVDIGKPEAVISGDFFTYTDRDNEYWSGYYTTRPFDKRNIRHMLELLKAAEVMTSLSIAHSIHNEYNLIQIKNRLADLQNARRTHGLVQHHDAITGTSAQKTVEDFELRISDAITKLQNVLVSSVQAILLKDHSHPKSIMGPLYTQLNAQQMMEKKIMAVLPKGVRAVFVNPHTRARKEIVSVFVNRANVEVIDQHGDPIDIQIAPVNEGNRHKEISTVKYEVFFEIKMPPLSLAIYTVRRTASGKPNIAALSKVTAFNSETDPSDDKYFNIIHKTEIKDPIEIGNRYITATFSGKDGTLMKMCKVENGKCTNLALQWISYRTGNSNAYCFGTKIHGIDIELEKIISPVRLVTGKLVSKIQIMHPRFEHNAIIYNTEGIQGMSLHIENVVNLDGNVDKDKELIMQFKTDVINKHSRYFTDANGFQLIGRRFRENLPIGANFYPMTSMVVLQDTTRRLTFHSTQPHGVGSLHPGQLEIMMDRAPTSDGKGLEEPVIDNKPAFSRFAISLEYITSQTPAPNKNRDFVEFPSVFGDIVNDLLQNPIQCLLSTYNDMFPTFHNIHFLQEDLPCDVVISNWKTFFTNTFDFKETGLTFHRRKNSCAFNENLCSGSKRFNFYEMFKNIQVKSVLHTSLTHLHKKDSMLKTNIDIDPGEMESYVINW